MPLFQTGAGYRDATKALTIKALQERQKQATAQMATASAAPDVTADPLSAISHVANVWSAGAAQSRADSREADARQQLAGIMAQIDPATGPTQAQLAEMQVLDPEFANRQYESAMEERRAAARQEDTQAFTSGENQATRDFTASQQTEQLGATAAQNDLTRQADIAKQKLADATAAGRQEDQQAAAQELAELNAKLDAQKGDADKQRDINALPQETAAREEEWKRLNPGGDITSPEAQSFILRNSAPATGGLNSPSALKDINEFKLQGTQLDSALNTVSRAEELLNGGNVVGGDAALWLFDKAGSIPGGVAGLKMAANAAGIPLTDQQIADTMEFDSIMGLSATEHMSNTLKGQSSNMEMQAFRRDMANRNAPDAVKRNAVQRMKSALMSDRGALDSTLQQFQQPAMSPYEYKSTAVGPDAAGGGDPLAEARKAIAAGADKAAVIKRLQENHIDPSGL